MSEAGYFAAKVARFQRDHPAADGWRIFELHSTDDPPWRHLPEFLAYCPPGVTERIEISRRLRRARAGTGLDETEWNGVIRIRWGKAAIHLESGRFLCGPGPGEHRTLCAANTERAVESLYRALVRYIQTKLKERPVIQFASGGEIPKPKVGWDDVVLPPAMAADIRGSVESFFHSRERYAALGLPYRRGFLMSGPPGCGKTLTARIIAATQPYPSIAFLPRGDYRDGDQLEGAVRRAEDLGPAILILEDLDKFKTSISISRLLNLLDGLTFPRGVLILATTNQPAELDHALLLRPSRFDRVWRFDLPGYEQRLAFLRKRLQGVIGESELVIVAKQAEGFSMAYVQEILAASLTLTQGKEIKGDTLIAATNLLRSQMRDAGRTSPDFSGPRAGFTASSR